MPVHLFYLSFLFLHFSNLTEANYVVAILITSFLFLVFFLLSRMEKGEKRADEASVPQPRKIYYG